jgi:hypothetical protein
MLKSQVVRAPIQRNHPMRILLGLFVFALGCGSDTEPVEVVSSTLSGSIDGSTLSAVYGVANTLESGTVTIAAGSGKLNCGSQASANPPGSGIYVNVQIPAAVVGVPEQHFFQFYTISGGDLSSQGSSDGMVEVLAVSEGTITIDVDYAQDLGGSMYQVAGELAVVLCD